MDALNGSGYSNGRSDEVISNELSEESGLPIPYGLKDINKKPVLHNLIIEKEDMRATVLDLLKK